MNQPPPLPPRKPCVELVDGPALAAAIEAARPCTEDFIRRALEAGATRGARALLVALAYVCRRHGMTLEEFLAVCTQQFVLTDEVMGRR